MLVNKQSTHTFTSSVYMKKIIKTSLFSIFIVYSIVRETGTSDSGQKGHEIERKRSSPG